MIYVLPDMPVVMKRYAGSVSHKSNPERLRGILNDACRSYGSDAATLSQVGHEHDVRGPSALTAV